MKNVKILITLIFISLVLALNAEPKGRQWEISTTNQKGEPFYGVMVGNGNIGIMTHRNLFWTPTVILNHVFDENDKDRMSYVLDGINPFCMSMQIDEKDVNINSVRNFSQKLDMYHASCSSSFEMAKKAKIGYTIRALRGVANSGMIEIEVEALDNIVVAADSYFFTSERYKNVETASLDRTNYKLTRTWALSKYRNVKVSATNSIVYDRSKQVKLSSGSAHNKISFLLKKGEKFSFIIYGTVCTSRDFIDPCNESDRQITYCILEGKDRLVTRHNQMWHELWQGDIIIDGDEDVQRAARLALYHLYSSCREGSRLSIPPFGLSADGYSSHIFWDAETWMYPPMLFLNKGIAESIVNYRIDRLKAAQRRATIYGYQGAMFPWESDDAGEESCPTWASSGTFEHHITADIAIAAWNYYCMYQDKNWLQKYGYELIRLAADFLVSRVEKNADDTYSIRNVVGADEYAENVNDNSFTNGSAIVALRNAVKVAKILGESTPAEWSEVAGKIRILHFPEGVTQEYEGYDGRIIKQADANLLAYPLGLIVDTKAIQKDIEYYDKRMDKTGPAMSHAILALQYARLGRGEDAYDQLHKAFKGNELPPFGVLSEGAGGCNPYFHTGAGGLLQALINGFCGLQLTDQGIKQLPSSLPRHWKSITVTGVGPKKQTYTKFNNNIKQ